ncbi:hypothetical protein Pmani_009944 [Petrolisthes manimaculis]|uniref:Uncharacterized protein n=1 Tax=Petrolisthes manimaculis TaxID=1843537 RepID=A0AAE1Q332_9EUCA|nr:hypothetical protein Pmani_009944 [Petrolisthes manimaculis]
MADPWMVTPGERTKHDEQFKTLRPVAGFITGDQAKGFFLQSRLPPQVLGIIWALSDVDGDGKMDLHEFSIACKLINLKLRGFNLPPTLPPSLKQSACVGAGGAPAPVVPVVPVVPVAPVPAAPVPVAPIPAAPVHVAPVPAAPVPASVPPMDEIEKEEV